MFLAMFFNFSIQGLDLYMGIDGLYKHLHDPLGNPHVGAEVHLYEDAAYISWIGVEYVNEFGYVFFPGLEPDEDYYMVIDVEVDGVADIFETIIYYGGVMEVINIYPSLEI